MFSLTASWEPSAPYRQIRECICLIWLLHRSLFMSGLACKSDKVETQGAYDPSSARVFTRVVCMLGRVRMCFKVCSWMYLTASVDVRLKDSNALSAGFLPAHHGLHIWCQCESNSLSYALLFPVLISRLGCVMLASHSVRSFSLSLLYLFLSLHLCAFQMWITCLVSLWTYMLPRETSARDLAVSSFHLLLHHSRSAKSPWEYSSIQIALNCNTLYRTVNHNITELKTTIRNSTTTYTH